MSAPARRRVALVSELAGLGGELLRPIEADFELVDRQELDAVDDEAALVAGLAGMWAVIAGGESYTERVLAGLPELRLIARCGVGFDAVDVGAATARGVQVSTTPDANSDGVADLTLALMLACLRRIALGDRRVRAGAWRPPGLSGDLTGATVGVVGLGRVGRCVVRRLDGFDCRVLAVEPAPDLDFCRRHGVEVADLDTVLGDVDVLSVHVPLGERTRGLIGARELALLRPSAVLVNTSRGAVVDETALVAALRDGRLAGAALDVYEREPLEPGHPLTQLDSVVLGTHSASFTPLSLGRMLASIHRSLTAVAAGGEAEGAIDTG